MTHIIVSDFLAEFLILLALLLDLLFSSSIISEMKWRRPIFIKHSFRVYLFTLFIVLSLYLAHLGSEEFSMLTNKILAFKCIVVLVAIIVLVYSKTSLKIQRISFSEFFFFYMIAVLSALLMLNANDLLFFYLVLEAQTLSFFVLACGNRYNIYSVESALKYYISGSYFSGIYLLGVGIIYSCFGTIDLVEMNILTFFDDPLEDEMEAFLLLGLVLVTGTILFKIGSFPFHSWLPDVYEGAPLASTIVFSLLPKLSLVFFLIKYLECIEITYDRLPFAFIVFGVLSVIIGTLFALKQNKLKRLIVYSSIVQVGFIVMGLAGHSFSSYCTVLFFTCIYLVTASLLWGILIILNNYELESIFDNDYEEILHSLSITRVSEFILSSVAIALVMTVAVFTMSGIPPLVGFSAKMMILNFLIQKKFFVSAIFLLTASSVSVYYYVRILKAVFFENIIAEKKIFSDFKAGSINTTSEMFVIHLIIVFLMCLTIFLALCPHSLYSIIGHVLADTNKMFGTDLWEYWRPWK